MVNAHALESKIEQLVDDFYTRRIAKISTLQLKDALLRKNPYLFRAIGIESAPKMVEEILRAYMSSSDEGIFGDAFFEPLVKFVISNGIENPSSGIDVSFQTETEYTAIAVKSGPSVFNSQSRKKQEDEFRELENRVRKLRKHFNPIVGYGYGKKQQIGNKGKFRELSGQVFWQEITGDANFYLKAIRLIQGKPEKHLALYNKAWEAAITRFTRDFANEFCYQDGNINWDKLLHFNSGKPIKSIVITPKSRTLCPGDTLQLDATATFFDNTTETVTIAREITYMTDKPFANVSASGLVQIASDAPLNENVKITATYGGRAKTITIKIKRSFV